MTTQADLDDDDSENSTKLLSALSAVFLLISIFALYMQYDAQTMENKTTPAWQSVEN